MTKQESVTRYVVTHIAQGGDLKGLRVLTWACQGRNTYGTLKQAQHGLAMIRKNNSPSVLAMYGTPDTLEVRAVECWPEHHDPMRSVFEG